MRRITSISVVLSTLLLISITSAQQPAGTAVPNLIRYSGTLKDARGTASVPSTTVGVTFSIYKQQDGGAPVWMETQNVTIDAAGNYSVLLGSTTAAGLPGDLFSQQEQRWLGVQVQGQAEQPRVLLVSVPYALKAQEAETLGGKNASDFVLANGANSSVNLVNSSQAPSSDSGNTQGTLLADPKWSANQGPTYFSGSTTTQIVAVLQNGIGAGVNATAMSKAVVGAAVAASGAAHGVEGIVTGSGGTGVLGNAISSTGVTEGVDGTSASISGIGVRATATASSGPTAGLSAAVNSASGIAGVFDNVRGGKILSALNHTVEQFSVDGNGNVTFGGDLATLSIGSANDDNLFVGVGAGANNVAGSGQFNVFSGYQAGNHNTTGSANAFSGYRAGRANTTGSGNTFTGHKAGSLNTTGSTNTFTGYYAGEQNTTGSSNTYDGWFAGQGATTGSQDTFIGFRAGQESGGSQNTFVGTWAGFCDGGSGNISIGNGTGQNGNGNNDIYIGNPGIVTTDCSGYENNTIRIGGDIYPYGPQTTTYIVGIYGSTVDHNGIPVYVDDNGQLGTVVSSLRFKEQVRDMGDSTSALMKLRPLTFLYKPEYSKGDRTLQYGLIAEEVAEVYPELVAYDNDGQPYTVRYQYITTMLLNEVQKQYHRAEAEAKVITAQQDQIDVQRQQMKAQEQQIDSLQKQNEDFRQRLSRLEILVGAQVKIAKGAAPGAGAQ